MAPGATNNPVASSTLAAALLLSWPILAILPFLMPMSARYRGNRVPSVIMPFLMIVSNSAIKPPFLLLVLVIGHTGFARPVLQDPDEVRTLLAAHPLGKARVDVMAPGGISPPLQAYAHGLCSAGSIS